METKMKENMVTFDEDGIAAYRFEKNPMEKAFVDEWESLNKACRTLEYILSDEPNKAKSVGTRDRQVAMIIIQWLGSPCGQGFLRDVQEKQ
jgi:hypothetical protein